MKKIAILLIALLSFASCADDKDFIINGKTVTVEPYGWINPELKHDSIIYKPNVGNIVLDIVFFETIIVPVWLTGCQLYEPIKKKK